MDDWMIDLLIDFGIPIVLIVIGFIVGSLTERRHFRRLIEREDKQRDILAFALRHVPADLTVSNPKLVCGSAVISVDYFKRFAAGLRGIVGGRMGAYESLLERARREALIRMKDDARRHGGNIVLNVKLESARIFSSGRATVSVEAVAYGTAYRQREASAEIH